MSKRITSYGNRHFGGYFKVSHIFPRHNCTFEPKKTVPSFKRTYYSFSPLFYYTSFYSMFTIFNYFHHLKEPGVLSHLVVIVAFRHRKPPQHSKLLVLWSCQHVFQSALRFAPFSQETSLKFSRHWLFPEAVHWPPRGVIFYSCIFFIYWNIFCWLMYFFFFCKSYCCLVVVSTFLSVTSSYSVLSELYGSSHLHFTCQQRTHTFIVYL